MKEKLRKYWRKYRYLAVFIVFLIVLTIILFPYSIERKISSPSVAWYSLRLSSIFSILDYLSPDRALITKVYPGRCLGEWFGADRVLGQPDVPPEGDVEKFNPENSAFYQGSYATIICEDFQEEFKEGKEKFISVRLGLSLAIDELKKRSEESETLPLEQIPTDNLKEENEQPKQLENQKQPERPEQIEESEPSEREEEPQDSQDQSEPVSSYHKFNDFIPLEIIPRRSAVWVTARSISHGKLNTPWEFLTGFIRTNISKIFPVLAQEELINGNINQVLTNESPESPVEPLLIEIPDETNQPIEDLTPVFLPVEIKTEEEPLSDIPRESVLSPRESVSGLDAILNLRYLLEKNTYHLHTFASYPISPATNNGYFYFDLPEVKSFNDLEKIKVSLEGLLGGNPRLISYLDSLWIEIIYEETEEIVPPNLEMEKNSWRSDEEPIIKINSQPNHLIKVDSFKKSLVKKLGIFPAEEQIKLSLIDPGNQEIALDLDKDFKIEEVNDTSQIKLLRPRSFRPGHYKLKFKIQQNKENAETEYDFQWGVLAINTNKSIYLSNEDAYLQMAALNDLGNTLCDANLRLSVLNETSNQETIFTTSDKSIEKSGQCGPNNVIDIPDYFVHYQVGAEGKYDLTLANLDNGYEIKDSFEVKPAVPFEVERIGPTRIYPLANYQMTIRIKTNKDFNGLITEIIPSSFKIVSVDLEQAGKATVSSPAKDQQDKRIINFLEKKKTSWNEQETEEKNISWQVDWQAGQSYELKYEFDAPDISPYFYLLGPLSFVGIHGSTQIGTQLNTRINTDHIRVNPCDGAQDQCISVFKEARQWQIASDAIVYIQTANATGTGSASAIFSVGVTVNNMIIAVCGANEISQLSVANFSTAIDQSAMPFLPPGQAIFYKVATIEDTVDIAISCISASPTAIVGLHIYEYRGLATSLPVDGTGSRTGSDSDPNSGVVTTSNADDLLMAGVIYLANVNGFSSWSNSFTERNDFRDAADSVSFGGAELIVSASGPYTTTATRGNPLALGAWRGQIAAFKMTSGITVYGTIYSDEGSTVFDCSATNLTITLKVNGLGTYSGPCITSQGTFAIPGVTISAANDVVTAYIDGALTQKGVIVTKAANTTSDININIYQNRLIVRHEGATSITNADLAQYDKDQDPDIHFDSDSGALIVDNDTELHIWTGKTFAPGGAVTTSAGGTAPGSDLHIDDNATFTAGGAISIGGNWTADTGTTFTPSTYAVTFTATATGKTIATNAQNFYDVTFNGSGGVWTLLTNNLDVNDNLNITTGTLVASTLNINLAGSLTIGANGFFTKGSGTFQFDSSVTKTWTDNTSSRQDLGTVLIDGTAKTINLGSSAKATKITIGADDTLNLGTSSYTLTLTGSGTGASKPLTINTGGTLTIGNSTVEYTGGAATDVTRSASWNYYNLTLNGTGPFTAETGTWTIDNNLNVTSGTFNLGGTTAVTNNVVINGGTLDVTTGNYGLTVTSSWTNSSGAFTARNGTVTFDAGSTGKTIDSGGTGATKDFYNIVFNNASGGWTIQTNNLTATNNFSITDTAAASGFIVEANRTITVNGNFTNGEGGTTTTWNSGTVLNLTKTGGGSYTINTKTAGGDVYVTLQVGANTDIRMWDSSASTYTVNASGSLYSMDASGTSGDLAIWGDYHTTSGNTDYWSYANDFDGTAGANRQVDVTISASTSVTVDLNGILYVQGGGSASNDITVVGLTKAVLWNFNCTGTCNVQESTWNYLNLTGGTLTVYNTTLNNEDTPDAGTLNVDWYLGDYVVDRASLAAVNTGDNDITISENSGTPASTVFVWSGGAGGGWGDPDIDQTTGTGADGKIPQPGTNGAIRIREYARASTGYTYYKYNLYITWQGSTYGECDYYHGYGHNYIISTLSPEGAGLDLCISELWQRNDIDAQNTPAQAIDEPPTNGTWYNGMISGLSFTVALVASGDCTISGGSKITTTATTVPYSTINTEHFYDACQSLTVSTSASEGYTTTIQETDQLTEPANNDQISDGSCDGGGSPCSETTSAAWNTATNNGFAYCMDDITGDAAATAQAVNWATAKQCGGGSQSFMINPENNVDSPDTADIMKSAGPISGDNSYIGFRLSVDGAQKPGAYSTTIVYVVTPTY